MARAGYVFFLLFFLSSATSVPEESHGHNATTVANHSSHPSEDVSPDHAEPVVGHLVSHHVEDTDHVDGAGVRNSEEMRSAIEDLISKAYDDGRLFFYCDLMRLYIGMYPEEDKAGEYITKLRQVQAKILERGRLSLAKVNAADQRLDSFRVQQIRELRNSEELARAMDTEALRLSKGDSKQADMLLKEHRGGINEHLEAALYLCLHGVVFPNSSENLQSLEAAADSAEITGFPLLEIEFRARQLQQQVAALDLAGVKLLAEKAAQSGRYYIAINVLDLFLKENYSHPKAGLVFLLSGNIHQVAGCYEAAVSKYNLALIWCGDMESEAGRDAGKPNQFHNEVAAVRHRANLSIGYALLSEANDNHLRESTAVFAGKLHGKAVEHFQRLVKNSNLGSLASLDSLLGLIRASVAAARYKQMHSSLPPSNKDIQNSYVRCMPPCEDYLRIHAQAFDDGDAGPHTSSSRDRDEVTFVLMNALFAIGKDNAGEALFYNRFLKTKRAGVSKWQTLAKAKIAERFVRNHDYLAAYPLLSEIAKESRGAGLRDVGFAAALMKGVCIAKLKPASGSPSMKPAIAEDKMRMSGTDMVREAYSDALRMLENTTKQSEEDYPIDFEGLFHNNIQEELVSEFTSELEVLASGRFKREAPLIEALSAVKPEKSTFNPNNLLVTAFLEARRNVASSTK